MKDFCCWSGVTLVFHQTLLISFIKSPEGVLSIDRVFAMVTGAWRSPDGGGTADRRHKADGLMDPVAADAPVSVAD